MEGTPMSSGQLARAAGLNVQTLRFYERRGLLTCSERTASGHRRYGPESLGLLRVIRRAQALGFTLAEISDLLDLRGDPEAECGDICAAARAKLDHVERQLVALRHQRVRLKQLVKACPGSRPLQECPIMVELEESHRSRRRKP